MRAAELAEQPGTTCADDNERHAVEGNRGTGVWLLAVRAMIGEKTLEREGFAGFSEVARKAVTGVPLGHGDCVAWVPADRANCRDEE